MSKLKSPLFSLGAHGSIGDALTIQRRNRGSFARKKPIPTDPKTDLQLAQRQIYRDAVDKWNALSPEEKEAWRGVCPGLTAYQCFISSELKYVEPTPPPEEYTEEQTQGASSEGRLQPDWRKGGQRLTIPNRKVTKLAFKIAKEGSPTGDVDYAINRVSDDGEIVRQTLCNASELSTEFEWHELEFNTPPTINEEVTIFVEFNAGDSSNRIRYIFMSIDVKANEYHRRTFRGAWIERTGEDCAYRYKYYLP